MSAKDELKNVLEFQDVSLEYRVRGQTAHRVLNNVSFDVPRGQILALVGESGSGKSTIARTVTGTLATNAKLTAGSVRFDGVELTTLKDRQRQKLRGQAFGYVPQDALLGLNPLIPVGRQASEPLRVHTGLDAAERKRKVLELFDRVGLRRVEQVYESYPHELSGGMCQRVLIAAAIAAEPKLIIADEPTTALDVTVQKRIMDLLVDLSEQRELSVLLVTHDLGIAVERAQKIVVLRNGSLIEHGETSQIVAAPKDEYTKGLILSSHLGLTPVVLSQARQQRTTDAVIEDSISHPAVATQELRVEFESRSGEPVIALNGVSLAVNPGQTLGIVGESGSGKTTLARTIAGLQKADSGTVSLAGKVVETVATNLRSSRELYRNLQFVYQNSYAALNPRHSVQKILEEPLTGFGIGTRLERKNRVQELLELTGLPGTVAKRYTAELSGGQRQRVAIARAIAPNPQVLICDEPVSALDVTVQRQILDLLESLQRELNLTYLFVSHDLSVISEISDDILVLQHGSVVEYGPAQSILQSPSTDYVRTLLHAVPGVSTDTVGIRNSVTN